MKTEVGETGVGIGWVDEGRGLDEVKRGGENEFERDEGKIGVDGEDKRAATDSGLIGHIDEEWADVVMDGNE